MKRVLLVNIALLILVLVALAMSLLSGSGEFSFHQVMQALWGSSDPLANRVIGEIRWPRALLAALIGFGLGISGAAMQGYLRNPLAEPGVLGISGAAALGAVLMLQFGRGTDAMNIAVEGWIAAYLVPISALLSAGLAALLVLILGGSQTERMVLIGIAISALVGAGTALALNLSPNPFAAYDIMFWLMGSVENRSMWHVWLALPFIGFGVALIISQMRGLDALSLGQDTAQSMGINTRLLVTLLVAGVAMIVGASVAVAGAIGFVGLVVPHMLRPFVGSKPSALLIAAGMGGALLLLLADILLQHITPEGRRLQLGVLTALIGAPVFIHLVIRSRKS